MATKIEQGVEIFTLNTPMTIENGAVELNQKIADLNADDKKVLQVHMENRGSVGDARIYNVVLLWEKLSKTSSGRNRGKNV
jgi:hypothetical protein